MQYAHGVLSFNVGMFTLFIVFIVVCAGMLGFVTGASKAVRHMERKFIAFMVKKGYHTSQLSDAYEQFRDIAPIDDNEVELL